MIRYSLLILAVTFLSFYSFRDWYKSLCGLVVLMAFIERYDMPRQMLGITGFNPWNILVLFVILGCLINARRENLKWDMPRDFSVLLAIYLIVIVVSFVRMTGHMGTIFEFYASLNARIPTLREFVLNDLLNCIKYVIPGLLMFYGAVNRSRVLFGIASCLLASLFLGLQIIKWMPLSGLADGDMLADRALRVLDRAIGYHRVDLAALMASASWGFFVAREVVTNRLGRSVLAGCGVLLILALALTGGRMGYVTWLLLSFVFAVIKWRKLVVVGPLAVLVVFAIVPAARERMLQGFENDPAEISAEGQVNMASVTSDRILIWPMIIDRITDAPLFGYGRNGTLTSGARQEMVDTLGEKGLNFPHPHNAFLEQLIDNGIVGALPIFAFFYLIMMRSIQLFRFSESKTLMTVGGIAVAYVMGQLIASIGGQSFYPRAGVVIMWCTMGLVIRGYVIMETAKKRSLNVALASSPKLERGYAGNHKPGNMSSG